MPDSNPTGSRLVRDKQLAQITGLHPVTIRRLATSGKIPSFKIGRSRRFDADAVLSAMAQGVQ